MKTIFLMATFTILFSCETPKPAASTEDAQFIFRGTVQQLNAANLPEIKDTQNTMIVKVDEVVHAPVGFTDWTGKSITVASSNLNSTKPEQKKLFFTNGWLYGESIAVVELGDGRPRDLTNEEVRAGIEKHQDDRVRERLKRASLIISGEVIKIEPGPEPQRISEHIPMWAIATVEVDDVLKGAVPEGTVRFLYPTSPDVLYVDAPNFDEGQKGIWLLHRTKDQELINLAITEDADFFSFDRLKYINGLLKD